MSFPPSDSATPLRAAVIKWTPRVLLSLVPVLSLGLLCAVPSLVIAVRQRSWAGWAGFGCFTAVTIAWVINTEFHKFDSSAWASVANVLLLLLATVGPMLHCLLTRTATKQSHQPEAN